MASMARNKRPPENASERETLVWNIYIANVFHARYTHHHQLAYIMFLLDRKAIFQTSRYVSSRSIQFAAIRVCRSSYAVTEVRKEGLKASYFP